MSTINLLIYNMVLRYNPSGHVPPGHLPQGHIPLDTYPLDTYPQDTYPLGHIPPEQIRLAQSFETERKKLLFTVL